MSLFQFYTEFLIINISTEEKQRICLSVKESSIFVGNATSNSLRGVLLNTKGQYMKESNILVGNVIIKQQQKKILLNTEGVVNNATIEQHQKEILLDTKGQYMTESNILAHNATIKQLKKAILRDIHG